jgi:hypothetical protein
MEGSDAWIEEGRDRKRKRGKEREKCEEIMRERKWGREREVNRESWGQRNGKRD